MYTKYIYNISIYIFDAGVTRFDLARLFIDPGLPHHTRRCCVATVPLSSRFLLAPTAQNRSLQLSAPINLSAQIFGVSSQEKGNDIYNGSVFGFYWYQIGSYEEASAIWTFCFNWTCMSIGAIYLLFSQLQLETWEVAGRGFGE